MARVFTRQQAAERSIIKTYRKVIWGRFISALKDFQMINAGDKIAVCLSGGKDSFLLAKCLQELKRHSETDFSVLYLFMDPGYDDEFLNAIKANADLLGIPIEIFQTDIFAEIKDQKNPCYLCAKKRRGALYAYAQKRGCNKIALGHHFDDIIETLLLSIIYGSQIQGMRPKLKSTNHPGMELIRPLAYVREKDIQNWAKANFLSFSICPYFFLFNKDPKRQVVKKMISELKKKYPRCDESIFKSMYHVNLDTLLGYKKDGLQHFNDE